MRRLGAAAACLLLAGSAGVARAQDRPGDFDFYVLSLSWSPSYCAGAGMRRGDDGQCARDKAFGFVLHGLWPQYERGFPSDCRVTGRSPTRAQVDDMLDLMPSPGLVRHEWRAHGTCSGLDPRAYFALARAAAAKIRTPVAFQSADRSAQVSPVDVERAFIAANPGMKPSGIAVRCEDGRLSEVRVCMTRELAFRPCPEVDGAACRADRVAMPAAGSR